MQVKSGGNYCREKKDDLVWVLYFLFMTDGKHHLLYDVLQTSKNDYYKEWQSFGKHDGAWRNNLSKMHFPKIYAWMEYKFLYFKYPYLGLTQDNLLCLYDFWVPILSALSMSYTLTEKQSYYKVTIKICVACLKIGKTPPTHAVAEGKPDNSHIQCAHCYLYLFPPPVIEHRYHHHNQAGKL